MTFGTASSFGTPTSGVMTEGIEDDVRFYIDIDVLLKVWDELWLSPHVRDAWYVWLRRRRLVA